LDLFAFAYINFGKTILYVLQIRNKYASLSIALSAPPTAGRRAAALLKEFALAGSPAMRAKNANFL
jgi:hypothetical protein